MRICLIDFAARGDMALLNAAMLFVNHHKSSARPVVGELVSPFGIERMTFPSPNYLEVSLGKAAWVLSNFSLEAGDVAPKLWADFQLVGAFVDYLKKNETRLTPVVRSLLVRTHKRIVTFDVTVIDEVTE